MMNRTLEWLALPVLLIGSSVFAQNLCAKCVKEAKQEFGKCMEAAISHEDKKSCREKQQVKATACETGVCKVDQPQGTTNMGAPTDKKSSPAAPATEAS